MSSWIDKKYVLLLATQLQRFKQKKDNLWNFRCVFCGDSEKNKTKARCYIYLQDDAYLVKCHNCLKSTNLPVLIKHVDLSLYREYVLERFNNKTIHWKNDFAVPPPPPPKNLEIIGHIIESVSVLPETHWLRLYLKYRKIPQKFWSELYYCPDYKMFVERMKPDYNKNLFENDPRLVIPFYNEDHTLVGFQGRTLNGNKIKYITVKLSDEDIKVYGIERVKKDQLIQVVEGPFDSMFMDNGIATCDSDLSRASKYYDKENLVLIWDNEYCHNQNIHLALTRAIDKGFNVCIFPKEIKYKDINEMVIEGMTIEEVNNLIRNNTFNGLRASLELQNR
jgi:transcription elongation factor Elf1